MKQQTAQYQAGQLSLFDLSTTKQNLTQARNDTQSKNNLWNTLESFRTTLVPFYQAGISALQRTVLFNIVGTNMITSMGLMMKNNYAKKPYHSSLPV